MGPFRRSIRFHVLYINLLIVSYILITSASTTKPAGNPPDRSDCSAVGFQNGYQDLLDHTSSLFESTFSTGAPGMIGAEVQARIALIGRSDLLGAYSQTFSYAFAIAFRERVQLVLDTDLSDFSVFERHWRSHNQKSIEYQYGMVGAETKDYHVRARAVVLAAFRMRPTEASMLFPAGDGGTAPCQHVVERAEDLWNRRASKCLLTIGPQDRDGHSIGHLESFIHNSYGSLARLFDERMQMEFSKIGMSIAANLPEIFAQGKFVAVHYRAGEVVDEHAGSGRFIHSSKYRNVLDRLHRKYPGLAFHVFTSAPPPVEVDDLAAFDGCTLHDATEVDMTTAWAIFIRAEAFVMSRSSFSHVPALFRGNRTGTYYHPMWHEPLAHWQSW